MIRPTQMSGPVGDLLAPAGSSVPRPTARAREIVRPQRASQHLPAPSDWTFELVEQYHQVIQKTASRFGLDT